MIVNQGAMFDADVIPYKEWVFRRACELGHECIVKYLAEHGMDVALKDGDYTSPLFKACEKGHENIVKCLVEHGATLEKSNDAHNNSIFRSACYNCSKDSTEYIVKYLVEQKLAIINFSSEPLIYACRNGCEKIVQYLISKIVS